MEKGSAITGPSVASRARAMSCLAFLTLVAAGALAVACSSTTDSTFNDKGTEDAEAPLPGPLVPDASLDSGADGGGVVACEPKIPDTFNPTWNAPVKQSACSTQDLEGYYDNCLADVGDTAKCSAWTSTHAACTACVAPANKSGPIQWHLDGTYVTLNLAGCIALVDDVGADSCGAHWDKSVQCQRQSCEYCFGVGGNFAKFVECQRAARGQGVCDSVDNLRQTKCQGISGTSGTAATCFAGTGDTEKVHYVRVMGLFCGQ